MSELIPGIRKKLGNYPPLLMRHPVYDLDLIGNRCNCISKRIIIIIIIIII